MKTTHITLQALLALGLAAGPVVADTAPSEAAAQAYTLRMDGQSDAAKALLDEALAARGDDASAWFELARTEIYHFQLDAAEEAVDKAIALDADNARYHYLAGLTAAYNGVLKAKSPETRKQVEPQMGKSLLAFKEAVVADPEFHEARIMLINMLIESPKKQGGDRAEAQRHVEILESKDPVYGLKARCMITDDDDEAVKLWQHIVRQHFDRADVRAGLADAYLRADELDEAAAQMDAAIRLDAAHNFDLLTLGRGYAMAKRYDQAESAIHRYLASDPALPAPLEAYARFYLAAMTKRQGDREKADEMLADARQVDPHCWTTFMPPPPELFDAP